MIGREDEVRGYRERAKLFVLFVGLAVSALACRIFYLQVLKGEELKRFSESNRLKKERLPAPRGIIFDRHGKVIVDNRAAFDVIVLSQYYPFSGEANARLAHAVKMTVEDLEKRLAKASRVPSFYPILIRADVDKDVIAAIEMDAQGFPGVDIEPTVQRRYPYGEEAAQLLGYIGEVDPRDMKNDRKKEFQPGDAIGKMGIERYYDSFLRGATGVGFVEVDAMGRRKRSEGERLLGFISQQNPVPGNNLYLTLDADLELAAAKAMRDRGFQGAVLAMDPRNGEVLALVNLPSYEPGVVSGREINAKLWAELSTRKDRPLRNRSIQDHYPPGSTFKLFLAIAGLAEGVVTTRSTVNCSGSIPFGSRRFNCWKRHGHVDFYRAIRESCDIFFYNLGHQLGVDSIAKYARMFGFGDRTGVRIAGEQRGLIPDTDWKKRTFNDVWHAGETLSIAIGQGFVDVTPIQLVTAYSAIANGGFVYRPYVVRRIERRGGEGIREYQPELVRKIDIPSEVFDAAREGLFQVVNAPYGTASISGRSRIVGISGKTGTAQVRAFADIRKTKCEELPVEFRHHGWFVGYAPRESPQIAVVAIAEHSCHGTSAAPVVREVIEAYVRKQAVLAGKPLVEPPPEAVVVKKKKAAPPEEPSESAEGLPEPPSGDDPGTNVAKKAGAAEGGTPPPSAPEER